VLCRNPLRPQVEKFLHSQNVLTKITQRSILKHYWVRRTHQLKDDSNTVSFFSAVWSETCIARQVRELLSLRCWDVSSRSPAHAVQLIRNWLCTHHVRSHLNQRWTRGSRVWCLLHYYKHAEVKSKEPWKYVTPESVLHFCSSSSNSSHCRRFLFVLSWANPYPYSSALLWYLSSPKARRHVRYKIMARPNQCEEGSKQEFSKEICCGEKDSAVENY